MRTFRQLILLTVVVALVIGTFAACDKSTGDDDDDNDDNDDSTASGVLGYSVYLNMAPVPLADFATAETGTAIGEDGADVEGELVYVADLLTAIPGFAGDAAKFTYAFVNRYDQAPLTDGGSVTLDDLASAVFYEDADAETLCLGWTDEALSGAAICGMDGGNIVTRPVDGAFEVRTLGWINERSGDTPAHLGEVAAVHATVSLGANTVVYGSYLKTFLSQDGYGLKVFADFSATADTMGYDGSLMSEIDTEIGDEAFIVGTVTEHDGMIEFVPITGYHFAVLSRGNAVDDPQTVTIDTLTGDAYRYGGALVRVDDLEFADVNPGDPTTDWPPYGKKSKEIRVRHTGGGSKIGLPIYENTGIPGSPKPADGFDAIGVFHIDGTSGSLYPRQIEDINPTDQRIEGTVRVYVDGESLSEVVDLADLPAGLIELDEKADPVPAVSIGSVIRAAGVTGFPRRLDYKPVAYDGRKPFDPIGYFDTRCGILLQTTPSSPDEPDPSVRSYFWEDMSLSPIYYLNGVTSVQSFREQAAPDEGDAVHGEGVTLMIDGDKYAIEFASLETTEYDGKEAIAIKDFVTDTVMQLYSMDGSFTTDQVRELYDYRLVSYDGNDETVVRLDDLETGYLVMDDPPYTVFPELGGGARVDDLYVIDMMRFIQVDFGGKDIEVVYLRDLPTEPVEVEGGAIEDVVFFGTVLEAAGFDPLTESHLYDYWLGASDDFVSIFPYAHNHLVDMFFRPYANRGYTVDPDIGDYGGRVSTKAIKEIELHAVAQQSPSILVGPPLSGTWNHGESAVWGTDAETCEGCHYKSEQVQIPVDCMMCHEAP